MINSILFLLLGAVSYSCIAGLIVLSLPFSKGLIHTGLYPRIQKQAIQTFFASLFLIGCILLNSHYN